MIGVMGNQFYGKKLVNILQVNNIPAKLISITHRNMNFKNEIQDVQIIHFIYSPLLSLGGVIQLIRLKLIWKKKILVTWIGTDTLLATTTMKGRLYSFLSKRFIDKHMAVAENLSNELKSIGIKAETRPLPFFELFPYYGEPKQNKIGIYLPDDKNERFNFFQGNLIKKLVKDFPNVSFIIFGNSGRDFLEKNVECIEWVTSMEEIYREVKAIIRLPIHDGLSNTIIEALSMGTPVISSETVIPGCKIIKNYEDLKKYTNQILSNSNESNEKISKNIHKIFNKKKLNSNLKALYNSI